MAQTVGDEEDFRDQVQELAGSESALNAHFRGPGSSSVAVEEGRDCAGLHSS